MTLSQSLIATRRDPFKASLDEFEKELNAQMTTDPFKDQWRVLLTVPFECFSKETWLLLNNTVNQGSTGVSPLPSDHNHEISSLRSGLIERLNTEEVSLEDLDLRSLDHQKKVIPFLVQIKSLQPSEILPVKV